jgi:glutamate-1-semialdehyde aminotransferase/spore coat polysaccharide biosynthesis protein SpsF (cytidylyltransferase family)
MANKLKIAIIVQAREDSVRFPKKVLYPILRKPLILKILDRLKKSKLKDIVIVAIPNNKKNTNLEKILRKNKCKIYKGHEENVLKRYYDAAKKYKVDIVIRITSDCPFSDPKLIDKLINTLIEKKFDYVSNTLKPTYPDGLDAEVFTFKVLKEAHKKAKSKYDREHVTPYIKKNKKFKKFNLEYKTDLSNFRLTVDEKRDMELVEFVFKNFKQNFSWEKIIKSNNIKKLFFSKSKITQRDEGASMPLGQKMWIRAKNIIPGGTMLFSKNPDLFLPKKWPSYFTKAKDCYIWDLENKKYLDMSFMGVGTNLLGYANSKIDNQVIKSIKKSNMSTLNSNYEIFLAEKLTEIHKWADMVRFARTGGEANSIAIRLARAFTKKDNIAVCGYHGWHDWYLSSNLMNKKNLEQHLLRNLSIKGVPKKLKGTVYPFKYNDLKQLKRIIRDKNIGVIKMEVVRNILPKNNFLKKVREIASKNNIVLIFDECTTGFRGTYGGLHKVFGVNPDMAIFGKAMGNGYAISAIIGKKEIMNMANETFISSTFWTEKIGYVAALATIEEMKKIKSWEKVNFTGKKIKNFWSNCAKKYQLKINIQGMDSLPSFLIISNDWQKYKTLISQELLKKKILGSNVFYPSIKHTNKILNKYFQNMHKIFKQIALCERKKININKILETPVALSGFKRLN